MTFIWKQADLEAGLAVVAPLHERSPDTPSLTPEPLPAEADTLPAVERQLRLLNRVAVELVQERERLLLDLRPDLLELAIGIAEQIVRHECRQHRGVALQTLTEALEQLHFATRLVVHVSLDDLAALEEVCQERTGGSELTFVADSAIDPGGCRLETDRGSIDATVGTQLARLRELLQQQGGC